MKRPCLYLLALVITVILATVNDIFVYVSPLLAGILVFLFAKPKYRMFSLAALLIGAAVFVNCCIRSGYVPEINKFDDCHVRMTLKITEYPELSDDEARAVCRIVKGPFDTENEKILVSFNSADKTFMEKCCVPGSIVEAVCVVNVPSKARNPGGFDYSLYLKTKGIYACASADSAQTVVVGNTSTLNGLLYTLREDVSDIFYNYMEDENAAVTESILFGSDALSEETLTHFRTVGIAHVLAVSGLHTGMIFAIVAFILKIFKANERTRLTVTVLSLIFYCALTGFSVSVIRASLMISFAAFTTFKGRKSDHFNAVCIAAILILLVNPYSLYSVSFILSFAAVVAIVVFIPFITNIIGKRIKKERMAKMCSYAACCVIVSLALLPINACFFNSISYLSPLANLLTVPLIGVIISLALLGACVSFMPPLSSAVFAICSLLLNYMRKITAFLSSLSFSGGYIKSLRPYEVIAFYIILLLVFGYLGLKYKKQRTALLIMSAFMFLSIGISVSNAYTPKLDFLDVGCADCCVITTADSTHVMIDSARAYSSDEIIDYLHHEDIHKLDYVIITHSDSDHAEGLFDVMERIPIDVIIMNDDGSDTYDEISLKASEKGILLRNAYDGDIIQTESFEIHVISPRREDYYTALSDNDRSIVCSVYMKGVCILMTADMTERVTERFLTRIGPFPVDILKAPHHGGYNEYMSEFCEAYHVRDAVVSVGANPYGLPSKDAVDVFSRLRGFYLTQDSGCVRVNFEDDGRYTIKPWRSE